MREKLAQLANEIRSNYSSIQNQAKQIRESKNIVRKIDRLPLDLKVCAVDGGILAHRMHGADIVVSRSAGVCFIYANSILQSCNYHPAKIPSSEIELRSSLDEHEANIFRTIIRLKSELNCALAVLQKYAPQLLLIDGSLLPLPSDQPEKESELAPLYDEVLVLYENLYSTCTKQNTILCGVIKDSRSRKLAKENNLSCSDTILCNYLLHEKERTIEMPYSEQNHALAQNIFICYLKPSKHDFPLRIEVLGKENVDSAANIVCSLSSISENFAYPTPLVEADLCAALDPKELEPIEDLLHSMCGMRPLRRNSRPFR